MLALCPSCQRPAVLDLPASMFHRLTDYYSCPQCDQRWTVEKRTGQLRMAIVPHAQRKPDRRHTSRDA